MRMNYLLLAFVVITMLLVGFIGVTDKTHRQKHFEDMERFRNDMEQHLGELEAFKNQGRRFTADDGDRHWHRMDMIELKIDSHIRQEK